MPAPSNNHQQHVAAPPANVVGQTTVTAARDVISVACKLRNGIIIREMHKTIEAEPVQGGGMRENTYYRPTEAQVVIHGTEVPFGLPQPILIEGGFRVTRDVPKDLWDSWYEHNKKSDLVRNGLIYASEKYENTRGHAREHEKAITGLEGVDPKNPSKHVRGIAPISDRPK